MLELKAAHASASDAEHEPLDVHVFAERVAAVGIGRPVVVTSQASTRSEYLTRPDLGRLPAEEVWRSGLMDYLSMIENAR